MKTKLLQVQIKETQDGEELDEINYLRKTYKLLLISPSLPLKISKATEASGKMISEAGAHRKLKIGRQWVCKEWELPVVIKIRIERDYTKYKSIFF